MASSLSLRARGRASSTRLVGSVLVRREFARGRPIGEGALSGGETSASGIGDVTLKGTSVETTPQPGAFLGSWIKRVGGDIT